MQLLPRLSAHNQERVNRILDVIIAYAALDFSKKTTISGTGDILDAVGAGVNMLGEELQASTVTLKEKEQLLKEVHHRVKNNLQIVSSLLKLQSEKVLDEKYQELITDSRNRIHSMAIVHELLYASRDLTRISISEYVQYLARSIYNSFARQETNIEFDFKIPESVFFDIDKMISLGLIVNEVISNSFKYAFPANKGKIVFILTEHPSFHNIVIADNGIGFPKNFNISKDGNLGMQLIRMLCEQMDCTLRIKNDNGTLYKIKFPK